MGRGEQLRPHTSWMGEADGEDAGYDEGQAYALLEQLLSGRRDLIGKLRPGRPERTRQELTTPDLLRALDTLVAAPATSPTGSPRSLLDIKQTLLAQSRQVHGKGAAFSREDNDAFELLGMLYSQIEREVRRDTPAVGLLGRLQVPLLRVALQDRAFFVRQQHPARQLLNAVAESGATWLGDEEVDPQLVHSLRSAVEHVVQNFREDPAAFETANRELQGSLQQLARKAEVTERRHVEAARGKEKLELAKRRSTEVIEAAVRDQRLPKFVRALLNQAWADVLTLSLLRHGEDSEEWQRQLEATRHIVAATTGKATGEVDPQLTQQIESSLVQVGYHIDEAAAIARRLTTGIAEDEDDPASRTELAMKLKARARLGEDSDTPKPKLLAAQSRRAGRVRTPAHPALRHVVRVRLQPAGRPRASSPLVVQPGHRQRVVREPARPAPGRAVARQPGAHDRDRPGLHRHRRQGPPRRPRLAGRAQRAAQLRRRQGQGKRGRRMIDEFRRAKRRKVADTVIVVDTMVDAVVGRLGNLSETGMLLMANTAMQEDALYQFRFNLNDPQGREAPIEVGAHLLWQDAAHASGQRWSGFRFITVPDDHMKQLREWIDGPGGQFE